jgi:predicted HTH domain antitoxin
MIQKMPENTRQKAIEQEGRLVLAINAIKKQQITKIREAARLYDVPRSTLQARLQGRTQ